MASGKKSKKTKGKTVPLTDFLQDSTGGLPTQPIRKSTTSWADEVNDEYDAGDAKLVNVVLPTEPKASRDYDDIANKVPKEPPFMAYLSNLPYDVEEEEIVEFFKNLKIANMRIPKDERSGEAPKLKGFGYVEFEDRESLMSALILPDTNLKNRRIRIEVAANAENDRRRGGGGNRMGSADTGGDWRSSNRPEPMEERRGGGGGFNRDRDNNSGFNRDREGSSSGGFTREGMRESGAAGTGRDRDYGGGGSSFSGRDREYSDFNRNRRPGAWRDGDRTSSNNFNDKNSFSSSNNRGGNYRDSSDRFERNGGGSGGGFNRSNMRNNDHRDERSENRDRDNNAEAPEGENRQRKKLNLAPRTKPLVEESSTSDSVNKSETAAAASAHVPSASIFGNAKPVDTAERERQIEEKLLKQQEERLRESSRDREKENISSSGGAEKQNNERGRPLVRREEKNVKDKELDSRDRGPSSNEKKSVSPEDNRKSIKSGHKSPPESRKKLELKPKREEKRDRPEKEMPKFQEPEKPNFEANNKFALLEDDDD